MNARQREQRSQRLAQASLWAQEQTDEALPSQHGFYQFSREWVKANKVGEVNLHGRVSTRKQNLPEQLKGAGIEVRRHGCAVGGRYGEVCSGKLLEGQGRRALYEAVENCKAQGIPLVTACFSRLLRNEQYHPVHDPALRPAPGELVRLQLLLGGVRVATLGHPDDNPPQDEETLRKLHGLARRSKGRNPDPPLTPMQQRKARWEEKVKRMRERGATFQGIADYITGKEGTPITAMAIYKWILADPYV